MSKSEIFYCAIYFAYKNIWHSFNYHAFKHINKYPIGLRITSAWNYKKKIRLIKLICIYKTHDNVACLCDDVVNNWFVCAHIHTYIYIYTYNHTYIHLYVFIFIHIHTYSYICIFSVRYTYIQFITKHTHTIIGYISPTHIHIRLSTLHTNLSGQSFPSPPLSRFYSYSCIPLVYPPLCTPQSLLLSELPGCNVIGKCGLASIGEMK